MIPTQYVVKYECSKRYCIPWRKRTEQDRRANKLKPEQKCHTSDGRGRDTNFSNERPGCLPTPTSLLSYLLVFTQEYQLETYTTGISQRTFMVGKHFTLQTIIQ